jgi:hypothetical protein
VVTRPEGCQRPILFEAGKAVTADRGQADANMSGGVTHEADLSTIRAGHDRCQIPKAAIDGG